MVIIRGAGLTIADIARTAGGGLVRLAGEQPILHRIEESRHCIERAVEANTPIYGVTTLFGGMADRVVPKEIASELQNNLVWSHTAGTGERLPVADVRAAMLLRANSLMLGASGVRFEIIRRLETFLNAGVTPQLREFGSIGASGDLVPLAYIAGAITGADEAYRVDFNGRNLGAPSALKELGLEPIRLLAKEGLALMNGTSVCTGVAANCVNRAKVLLAITMTAHALLVQALEVTNQSFHPFVHALKPHPGQLWSARQMLELISGSKYVQDELDGQKDHQRGKLIQDRYSVRCLPQYMGPIVDGIAQVARQVEIEANSATDNPLIDVSTGGIYHCGNFLAQYIGVGMDQLRYYIGLLAKHLDVQIALLVSPEFNNGLPASLVGNSGREVNVGLKPLQLTANSIAPMLSFLGNSMADRFPTHAEQFNQNINSQAFGSANLTRQSLDIFTQYAAIALMFGVQAADLRTYSRHGHYDARECLSPATRPMYEAVKRVTNRPCSGQRPFVWDDSDQFLDSHIDQLTLDIAHGGAIPEAAMDVRASLDKQEP